MKTPFVIILVILILHLKLIVKPYWSVKYKTNVLDEQISKWLIIKTQVDLNIYLETVYSLIVDPYVFLAAESISGISFLLSLLVFSNFILYKTVNAINKI